MSVWMRTVRNRMMVAEPEKTSPAVETSRPPSGIGAAVLLAAVFFTAALTPSLMPRSPLVQGVLAGISAAVGFEIARLIRRLWDFLELPWFRSGRPAAVRALLFAGAAAIFLYGLWCAAGWQNATRAVIGLDPVESSYPIVMLPAAAVAFLVIWTLFRLLTLAVVAAHRLFSRFLPRRISFAIGLVLVVWLTWAFAEGVVGQRLIEAADASFEFADSFIDPEIPQPASPMKTGSSASLVRWQEMGVWGRAFVASAPTQAEIAAFAGPDAMEPIRVYVGLRGAETAHDRAELALGELIRAGAFDRSTLVIVNSTGTGWMDPGAQDTLDFMLGGDVATVAVQYSYLPSVLSLLANAEVGVDQARALFDVIYGYWTALPRDARPKLYVHGLSLGAFNLQKAVPLVDLLGDPIQGAFWVGSPFFSPIWERIRMGRHADSPAWRPRYGNGSLARTMNQQGFADGEAPWGPIRLIFLTYGSDAIAVFSFSSAWAPPNWLAAPLAFDVSPRLRWFPLVTMLQVAVDTAFALEVPAYGHYYLAEDYIEGWAALLDPPGWDTDRAETLKAIFAARPLPM